MLAKSHKDQLAGSDSYRIYLYVKKPVLEPGQWHHAQSGWRHWMIGHRDCSVKPLPVLPFHNNIQVYQMLDSMPAEGRTEYTYLQGLVKIACVASAANSV